MADEVHVGDVFELDTEMLLGRVGGRFACFSDEGIETRPLRFGSDDEDVYIE
jgi:hypothetical protein